MKSRPDWAGVWLSTINGEGERGTDVISMSGDESYMCLTRCYLVDLNVGECESAT